MFKNRLILVLGVISLLSVTMAVSYPRSNSASIADQGTSDFHQRHPDWQWVASDQKAIIPLTGDAAFPDYYERHPELSVSAIIGLDASDYFQRHPELTAPADASVDTTDYYFRHLGLSASVRSGDLTDYFFRHPELRRK
jgi:hypothetical protein